ncbi:MAG: arsenical-resistance protein, partial [Propionibacteriaceae bacterium]
MPSELAADEQETRARLSTTDRFLPVWIVAAMGLGLLLGRVV